MTKGELRKRRKDAVARGLPWQAVQEDGQVLQVRARTRREEARHQRAMYRWARQYDALNGAPESDLDR